jgi:hypothetical protein
MDKDDTAQNAPELIASQLLTARTLLRAWLEETSGDDEQSRIEARKFLGLPAGWPHDMTVSNP